MSDCSKCGYRLETCAGIMEPFCANFGCPKFNRKSCLEAERRIENQ